MKNNRTPIVNEDRFVESIYHLVVYGNTIRCFRDVLASAGDKMNGFEKMVIRYSIQSNVMIMTISILDELNKYLFKYDSADKEVANRIGSYKYIIEPMLNEITKWGDLRKFRNNVLAHNFRIDSDGYKSVHLNNKLSSYIIPEFVVDLITLFKYLDSITKIAEEIFQHEYKKAQATVNNFENKRKQLTQTLEDEAKKVNSVLIEVNERINVYNSKLNEEQK